MPEPTERILALGYGLAAVVILDQGLQLAVMVPMEPVMRYQLASAAAARLLSIQMACLVTLLVGVRLGHRAAVLAGIGLGGFVTIFALTVIWSVLWDGAHVLTAFGPPGGNLFAFQGTRLHSLVGAVLALCVAGGAVPAMVRAYRTVVRHESPVRLAPLQRSEGVYRPGVAGDSIP